jgi:DNA ligase-1
MKRFARLFMELDASSRTTGKLAALRRYFRDAPAEDAAWAVYFLIGNKVRRAVRMKDFRVWAGGLSGYPEWMVEECYDHVGDLAETLALLLAGSNLGSDGGGPGQGLRELVEDVLLPLRGMEPARQREVVEAEWCRLDTAGRLVFNKLLTGGFRVGVSRTLVTRALAEIAGVEPAVMAHRLMGDWQPSASAYHGLFAADGGTDDPARPYPFCLAYPLDAAAAADLDSALGPAGDWQAEWKWDGIRAQLIRRGGRVLLWSRGEELVGGVFPELVEAAALWSRDAVLDGEILVWREGEGEPAGFAVLQRRLGRKTAGPGLRREAPAVFMAYDLLELDGKDLRSLSLSARREHLEVFLGGGDGHRFRLSPVVEGDDWAFLAADRARSRGLGVEGLMFKRLASPYGAGRRKGDWWKWKVEPLTVDAVLVYAQQGHGRRAGLFTDYTFSVWDGDMLVPFAKAYSGLSDAEIRRVDRWIRAHTRERHGPVRVVDPELVFEIAFEGIAGSKRHKSGLAVRFPRILRWREDKPAAEADTLETVRALL